MDFNSVKTLLIVIYLFCPVSFIWDCFLKILPFNFRFIKHIYRGYNTCSRCDFEFQPLPESKLARKREDRLRKGSAPPGGPPHHHSPASAAAAGGPPRPLSTTPHAAGAPPGPPGLKEERRDELHRPGSAADRRPSSVDKVAVSSAHPSARPGPHPGQTPSPNLLKVNTLKHNIHIS